MSAPDDREAADKEHLADIARLRAAGGFPALLAAAATWARDLNIRKEAEVRAAIERKAEERAAEIVRAMQADAEHRANGGRRQ